MSQTQEDKQQDFREKLQAEGADGFADGPRPWEHWDESGNQNDNRIWEGTARRVYPKQPARRGFGDRVLSGLAVIALGSMLIGIAGVYLSTPSTQRMADSMIQPPPIVAGRKIPHPDIQPAVSADTSAPVIAGLDILAPPAAGIRAVPEKPDTAMSTTGTAPAVPSDSIDRVTVESAAIRGPATTPEHPLQTLQEETEPAATIETTVKPFTRESAQREPPPAAAATVAAFPAESEEPAAQPAVVARAGTPTAKTETTVIPFIQETAQHDAPAAVTATVAAFPAESEEPAAQPAVVARAGTPTAKTETTVIPFIQETAQRDAPAAVTATVAAFPAESEEPAAQPAVVARAGADVTGPAVPEQTETTADKPAIIALTGFENFEPPASGRTESSAGEPAVAGQTAQAVPVPAPAVAQQAGETVTEPADVEQSAVPVTGTVALNTTGTDVEAAPEITRELETASRAPVLPGAKTGNWVINLSSYTRKRTAERMLAVFKQKGVDAEVFTTTINDKPMHRIRVAGFDSARSARAEISALEQRLDLDGAWVSRR